MQIFHCERLAGIRRIAQLLCRLSRWVPERNEHTFMYKRVDERLEIIIPREERSFVHVSSEGVH